MSNLGFKPDGLVDIVPGTAITDNNTAALMTIDYPHHEVHEGSHFYAYHNATLAITEDLTISVTTPDSTKHSHLIFKLSSSDAAIFDVLEDVTSFANGTAFVPKNNNRNSATVSVNTVLSGSDEGADDPITPTGGTEIYSEGIKSGNKIGGTSRGDSEIILKQNSKYLFRIISGANTNVCSIVLEWYEHTSKEG